MIKSEDTRSSTMTTQRQRSALMRRERQCEVEPRTRGTPVPLTSRNARLARAVRCATPAAVTALRDRCSSRTADGGQAPLSAGSGCPAKRCKAIGARCAACAPQHDASAEAVLRTQGTLPLCCALPHHSRSGPLSNRSILAASDGYLIRTGSWPCWDGAQALSKNLSLRAR